MTVFFQKTAVFCRKKCIFTPEQDDRIWQHWGSGKGGPSCKRTRGPGGRAPAGRATPPGEGAVLRRYTPVEGMGRDLKGPHLVRACNGPGFPNFPGPATRFCENAATRFPETAVFTSVLIFTVVYPLFHHQVWPSWGGRSYVGVASSMGKWEKGLFWGSSLRRLMGFTRRPGSWQRGT